MVAQLIALVIGSLIGTSTPAALTPETQALTAFVPHGQVLEAQTQKSEVPEKIKDTTGPDISAESYVVIDVASGSLLASKDPHVIRPVASLTKLLTALTVGQKTKPEDVVIVGSNPLKTRSSGSYMDLEEGEKIRVQDLLAGLLISSANDAAVALAEHVSTTESAFSLEMNKVAQNYGLQRTHAMNSTGFDNKEHFSSPYDMATLLLHAWRDPLLGIFLRAKSLNVTSVDGKIEHRLMTTDRLLGERTDVLAGKTGFTDAAGQSLAIVAEKDNAHPVIAVLLGSSDRFGDMNNLLNWTFWAYDWKESK